MISKIKIGWRQCLMFVVTLMMAISVTTMTSYAKNDNLDLVSKQVLVDVTDNYGDGDVDGDNGAIITVTGKKSLIWTSAQTTTIEISSNVDTAAKISFDFALKDGGSLKIDGTDYTSQGSGAYRRTLYSSKEKIVVKLTSQSSTSVETTLTLSNITYEIAASSSQVTFEYDDSLGSITVGGEVIVNKTTKEIAVAGAELIATPFSGASFLGWVDAETGLLCATDGTLKPTEDCTVKAVFVNANSNAWFEVDTTHLFDDLNKACEAGSKIILANDGKLPAGEYTIPAGKTLLIPFDDANTLYTNKPQPDVTEEWGGLKKTPNDYQTPTVYRKLIMEDGANITVNGAISLSAKHYVANGGGQNAGSPSGPCSYVEMKEGSNITVNSGGNLYAWGFIYGNGTVTANSGATLYENMQINDFRGGSATSAIAQSSVFPFSQYYLQNIEVPLTIYAGASEKAYTSLYMSSMVFSAEVPFIAKSDAMFVPQSGYIVKDYNEQTDRLDVDIYGDISISSMAMSMGTSNINTATMNLPITNNITVNVHSGTITANQHMVLLPGSEINIGEEANMVVGEGINAYAVDKKTWNSANYVINAGTNNIRPLGYKVGSTVTREVADLKDARIVVDGTLLAEGNIYSTANGADICSTGNGEIIMAGFDMNAAPTLEQYQNNNTLVNLPVTMAKLHNADGTYLTTFIPVYDEDGNMTEESILPTTGMYFYENGIWDEFMPGFYYDANGGTGEMTPDIAFGDPIIIHDCEFEREGYVFMGWSTEKDGEVNTAYAPGTEVENVDEEITLYAVWEEEVKSYSITWNVEGKEISADVDAGEVPSYPGTEAPAKDADVQYTYEFAGWAAEKDGAVLEVIPEATGNVTYYAVFNKTLNKYVVIWNIDGVNHEVEYDYGTIPVCEISTAKAQEGCTVYTFDGWDKEIVGVTEETVTYTAQYSESESHDMKDVEAKAATCEEDGYTAHKACTRCNYKEGYEVVAKGHNLEEVEAKAATCTEDGYTAHKACTRCDYKEGYEVEKAGHKLTHVDAIAATCEKDGNVAYDNCTACGKNFAADGNELKTVVVEKTGHNHGDWVVTQPATCTEDGVKAKACVCGDTITDVIPSTGHAWDEGIVDPEPTCTTEGTRTFTCETCGATKTEAVEMLDHKLTHVEAVAAECGKEGNVEYWNCSECNNNYDKDANAEEDALIIEDVVTKALVHEFDGPEGEESCIHCGELLKNHPGKDHTYGEFVTTKEATCTEAGLKVKTCTCGDVIEEVIDATAHDLTEVEAVEATCTEAGNVAHWHCANCGLNFKSEEAKEEEIIEKVIIDALGHQLTHHDAVPATCTEDGTVEYWDCSGCDTIFGAEDMSIILNSIVSPLLGHNLTQVEAKDATCTENGNKTYWVCLACEAMFDAEEDGNELTEEDVVITAEGHKLTHYEKVEATCVADGNVEYWNCEVCNTNFDAEENGEVITNVVLPLDEDNHDIKHFEAKKATCIRAGHEAYDKCMREGCDYTTFKEIPKSDQHDYIMVENVTSCIDCGRLAEDQPVPEIKAGLTWDEDGKIRYYVDGEAYYAGLVRDTDGHYYYINSTRTAVTNCVYTIGEAKANGLLPAGKYEFDAEGKMIGRIHDIEQDVKNGLIKDEDGKLRYYVDGEATYAGVVQDAEGNYYYINSSKAAVTNCTYTIGASRTNGLVSAGTYQFDADGKMVIKSEDPAAKQGLIKDEDGKLRYYVDGEPTYAGVVRDAEGNYYYINSTKTAVTNCTYSIGASRTNGLVSAGTYQFDENGKMIIKSEEKNGLYKDTDGKIRYYENGTAIYAGLVQDTAGNYYYINSSLSAVTDSWYGIYASKMNGISEIKDGIYYFDNGGKLSVNKAWDGTIAKESSIYKLIDDEGVIQIKTSVEFASVFNYLTNEAITSGNNTKVIKQIEIVNDIDLGNVEWILNSDSTIFNDDVIIVGNNHSISNLNGTLLPSECNVDYSSLIIK